jgi:16S rRNA (guanine527-N7)-methyltransferase
MPDHVSRETGVPAPPATAQQAFGRALPLACEYAEILATEGVTRGLIGPGEAPRLWDRHLLNCVAVAPLIPEGATVCDVGSGAGLPGLVLALRRPDVRMILLEPMLRRAAFLTECVVRLRLGYVEVVRGRAEDQVGRLAVDVVVARAVARLDRLARWSLPLLAPGGQLLALKGASADEELAVAIPLLRQLGAREWDVRRVGADLVDPPTTVVRIAAGERPSAYQPTRRGRRRTAGSAGARRPREG